MMESLLQWDTSLMHWINTGWSNPVFDLILPALRNKYLWIPLYVFCIGWILYNFTTRQSLWALGFIALSIFGSDTLSSKLVKDQIRRPRPCHVLDMSPPVILRVPCGGGYSFTSSHATNHFCLAAFLVTVFGYYMGRWRHLWWLWAFAISVSQVYVGVHYPLDILGGGILGSVLGLSMGTLCKHKMKQLKQIDQSDTGAGRS